MMALENPFTVTDCSVWERESPAETPEETPAETPVETPTVSEAESVIHLS
jgi:hypothetical protein